MKEFEELEGLGNQVIDEVQNLTEDKDDDDSFKPANASQLSSNDVFYEVIDNYWYHLKFRFPNYHNAFL